MIIASYTPDNRFKSYLFPKQSPKYGLAKQLLTHVLHPHHTLEAGFSSARVTIGFLLYVRCFRAVTIQKDRQTDRLIGRDRLIDRKVGGRTDRGTERQTERARVRVSTSARSQRAQCPAHPATPPGPDGPASSAADPARPRRQAPLTPSPAPSGPSSQALAGRTGGRLHRDRAAPHPQEPASAYASAATSRRQRRSVKRRPTCTAVLPRQARGRGQGL